MRQNKLPPGKDPGRPAFELNVIILAPEANFVLHYDSAVLDLACQVARSRFGLGGNGNTETGGP